MKKLALVLLMSVMLAVLGACGTQTTSASVTSSATSAASTTSITSSSVATASQGAETETTAVGENGWTKVGEVVTVEGIQYTINGFKNSNGSSAFAPEDGKSYCLVDITVKNDTKEEALLSSMLMFGLTDANGKSYDISLCGLASLEVEKLTQLDGSVPASNEMRGGLAYEVPKDAKGLTLAIKEILGAGEQKVKLN